MLITLSKQMSINLITYSPAGPFRRRCIVATASIPLVQAPSCFRFEARSGDFDDGISDFLNARARLFGIAYRMLKNAADAEDILQEVWLRWQSTNRGEVENPPAFLATTTTRLCINFVQSARWRHEVYVENWTPECVDASCNPATAVERDETLKLAVQLLLEKLSAAERAAFILREAFDFSYGRIAGFLQLEVVNTRKLVSRARKRLTSDRCTAFGAREQRRLLDAFITAAQQGDMAALEGLLA
jgi:RNA polymerase sigma factor (sigma-70 family)